MQGSCAGGTKHPLPSKTLHGEHHSAAGDPVIGADSGGAVGDQKIMIGGPEITRQARSADLPDVKVLEAHLKDTARSVRKQFDALLRQKK